MVGEGIRAPDNDRAHGRGTEEEAGAGEVEVALPGDSTAGRGGVSVVRRWAVNTCHNHQGVEPRTKEASIGMSEAILEEQGAIAYGYLDRVKGR
jgi:hypothetical protein